MLFAKQFSWTSKSVPIDFLRKSAGLAKVFYRGEYKLLKKERIRILSIVNKGLYKFCLRLKLELLYFRKKLFIFHIWDRICRCRRQETFQFSKPKYFICEVEEKWFGRYKITPHILGAGPKWNSKTTLLPPIRENNLSDTIWPFHGFLALSLEKFTAWLYRAKSFSSVSQH